MIKVVVAPDKFKGSLAAPVAARAIARGVAAAWPAAEVVCVPMADGGEGTVEALVQATSGSLRRAIVAGPFSEPLEATYGLLGDGQTAVIEMAAASGLVLVPKTLRDPRRTTTRGTGELLLAAITAGARRVILGIGGSATNDGGAGFAQALGFRLKDAAGRELGSGGGELEHLAAIDPRDRDPRLAGVDLLVACDVDNPLCGPRGASAVFGPQKGATPEMVALLDRNLAHFAAIVQRDLGVDIRDVPGAGAAGGLGGGVLAFANGRLQPGAELVIRAVGLERQLTGATLCLTGEGAIDASSVGGKTAVAVGRLAHTLGCPCIALAGTIGPGALDVLTHGIDAYFSICPAPIDLDQAVAEASTLLAQAAEQVVRSFRAGHEAQSRRVDHDG